MVAVIPGLVQQKPNGHLECIRCNILWCEHIEAVIEEGYDYEMIWEIFHRELEENVATTDTFGMSVEIPIDGLALLFLNVQLRGWGKKDSLRIEYLRTGAAEPAFIGFLNLGEGRGVIRDMLDNWLFSFNFMDIQCKNKSHGFTAQMEWEARMKAGADVRRREYWSIIMSGNCMYCRTISSADDFSDLVPDDKKDSVWSK